MAIPSDNKRSLAGHPVWMEVDLARLAENLKTLRTLASPSTKLIASIKANAYGHGVVPVARVLEREGCDALATGSLRDAVALREAGVEMPILMFGRCLPEAYPELLHHRLIPTIHTSEQADALSRVAGAQGAAAYVKVDAGLGRLGIPLTGAEREVMRMSRLPGIVLSGLYTHLPFSQLGQRDAIKANLSRFADLVARLAAQGVTFDVVQARASSALLSDIDDPFNAVCPGHALYGLEPSAVPLAQPKGLQPVLRAVRAHLIQTESGPAAGKALTAYGSSGRTARRGVIPVGQVDGLASNGVANGQYALLRGHRLPFLSVSFEHTVLDISACDDCTDGDVVTLLGAAGAEEISLEQFAKWRGATVKDALMALSGRIATVYS